MRLLFRDETGEYRLGKELANEKLPKYAILSHTWLLDARGEVSLQDLTHGIARSKAEGYSKIQFCGEQASKDGLDYFWLDTCCIDQHSSAVLEEAIISMFSWYRKAAKCYVYLWDISINKEDNEKAEQNLPRGLWEEAFRNSRWFTRGWTLQELLAPKSVEFFSREGLRLGDKSSLESLIFKITTIPVIALQGHNLMSFSVEERLRWTANRQTKRKEDRAYCLLGIFGVSMTHRYGEGDEAFERLRRKIRNKGNLLSRLPIAKEAAFNSLHSQHEPICLKDTRTDLIKHIQEWAESNDNKKCGFWLNGLAGTGKSTIARTIARIFYNQGRLGGSFFFSKGGGEISKASKLATTLAGQLAAAMSEPRRYICEAIGNREDIIQQSFRDQWKQLIIDPLSRISAHSAESPILLVIDALDECDDENDIRSIIRILASASGLNNLKLRILITSRPETPIRHGFNRMMESEREVFILQEIPPDVVNQHLRTFFNDQFRKLREERESDDDDWPDNRSIGRLVENASGLFIWAATACRFICEGRRFPTVKKRLESLCYGSSSVEGSQKKLDEIYTAVLQDFIQGVSIGEREEIKDRCIDLRFRVDDKQAHGALADNCISVTSKMLHRDMCNLDSSDSLVESLDSSRIARCLPLELQYACLYWVEHCRQSGMWISDGDRVHQFFNTFFLHWLDSMSLMGKSSEMGGVIQLYHSLLAPDCNVRQIPFVKDARRFIFNFQNIIRQAPSQIHGAALAFIPPTNELKSHFWKERLPILEDACIAEADAPKAKDEFNYVSDLAFTPDSKRIASGSNFEAVRFWDVGSMATLQKFQGGSRDKISSVAISPDGKCLAGGSDDSTVMLWSVETGDLYCSIKAHSGWVNSVTFSPDGKSLVSGSMDQTVAVWKVVTGEEVKRIKVQSSGVNSVTFSPNGSLLATGSVDGIVRLWSFSEMPEQMPKILDGHLGPVNSLRFCPRGNRIASGSDDLSIKLWDTSTETFQSFNGHTKKAMTATFSPDARVIASGSQDRTVRLWDAVSGATLKILDDHTSGINSVLFSPDGTGLASSSFNDEVRLWDTKNWVTVGKLDGFEEDISSGMVAAYRAYPTAFGGATDHTREFKGHSMAITCVTSSPDERWVASGSHDSMVKLWLLTKEQWNLAGHSSIITDLCFSPDSRLVASASADGIAMLWDCATAVALFTFCCCKTAVLSVYFSPDSQLLGASFAKEPVRIWDSSTGQLLFDSRDVLGEVTGFAFSPNNLSFALLSSHFSITLWDQSTSLPMSVLRGHIAPVTSVKYSQDGKYLVSCSEDATVRLWNTEGDSWDTVECESEPAKHAALSPDNQPLVYCSANGTIRLWDVKCKSIRGFLQLGVTLRSLSFSNCGQYIETKTGAVGIRHFSDSSYPSPQSSGSSESHTVFVGNRWLSSDMKNAIWLPEDYVASDATSFGNTIVMGHFSGSISFVRLV
ncbi:vegetative incompatibility protein het-E-1 [Fusarium bulbicola]|nr:vegetative incompatibility protein het-E-1 [Fusarium bulbicola]